MKLFSTICCLIVLACYSPNSDWELSKEKDQIVVYTRKVPGSSFKAFKGMATYQTKMSTLIAVFMDIPKLVDWLPRAGESRLLEHPKPNKRIYYLLSDAPWPVSDRDGIYSSEFIQDPKTKAVTVKVGCHPDYLPTEKGRVRIRQTQGYWKFTPKANGMIEVIYENHAEPGGNIPAWLANSSAVDIPFNSLKNLRKQLQRPEYQNQSYSFIQD